MHPDDEGHPEAVFGWLIIALTFWLCVAAVTFAATYEPEQLRPSPHASWHRGGTMR